jgi:IS5 family transposase
VVAQPKVKRLLSSDHFSVDGTLLEAWASLKSFRRKDGDDNDSTGPGRNAERHFHKEKRSNETHRSTTDPEARLYRKGDGQPAKLCYMGHALMENRHGLVVGGVASLATGMAERQAALELLDRRAAGHRVTLAADKAYDVADFVAALRSRSVSAHVAIDGHVRKTGRPRRTAVDRRTTRHAGYAVSQRCRKRIEEVFGWIKASAGLAKVKLRGRARVDAAFTLALAAYNLIRLPKLLAAST